MVKMIFAVEKIQGTAERDLVNRFYNWSNTYSVRPSLIYEALNLKFVNYVVFLLHRIKADTAGRKWYCGFMKRHTTKSEAATC